MKLKQRNILFSSTLLITYSFSALASVEKADFQSQAHIYPQPPVQQLPLESREQLNIRIKAGVTAMLNEPRWEERLENAVKTAMQEQAKTEKENKEIIALIVEELKTNGPSKQENIALNKLAETELKMTLDNIIKTASVDVNQQVSAYKETIKHTEIAKQDSKPTKTMLAQNSSKKQKKGWVYVGQFFNKNWSEKLLNVDVGLPKKGSNYLLQFSANVRDSLPSKQLGMSNVIGSLTSGKQIKVLNVHPSGSKGHYWALVEWLK